MKNKKNDCIRIDSFIILAQMLYYLRTQKQ